MSHSKKPKKRAFPYPNLLIAYISFLLIILLSLSPLLRNITDQLVFLGLLGAFIGGMLYATTFTFSAGILALILLAPHHNFFVFILVAGLGGLVADLVIFHFVKDNLSSEIIDIFNRLGGKNFIKTFHLKFFAWLLPVIGAIIIASPFPDELGVSLMGISKMKQSRFAIIAFILDSIGIAFIIHFSDLFIGYLKY